MSIFMSPRELEELTGYKLASYQRDWLKANNYRFEMRRNGTPALLRREVEHHLLSDARDIHGNDDVTVPDFSAMAAL